MLVLLTRLVPLLAAPLTLYLVATRWPADEQGFYFILVNVQALAPLIELGAGSIVVQFVSHESSALAWGARGALQGDAGAVARVLSLVREGWRWYCGAALVLLLALPLGLALFGARARSDVGFGAAWTVVIVSTALYLPLVPLLCTIEGARRLMQVQRMRLVQTVVGLAALWVGLLTRGALFGVASMAVTWVVVAAVWLEATHGGLVRQAFAARRSGEGALGVVQWRTGFSWLTLWAAPQLLAPLVLAASSAAEAGRVGMSLAIATAPATLGAAWLQSRYPRFAATLVAEGRGALDVLARRAAAQALSVCLLGGVAVTAVVAVLHREFPVLGARVLPTWAVAALCATGLVWVAIQAMSGYLRSDRAEPMVVATTIGVAMVVIAAAVGAMSGAEGATVAYSGAVVLGALPVALISFVRARRRLVNSGKY